MKFDVWVVIPAYNEGKRILDVVKKVKRHSKNIVVVDDGSKDDTEKKAQQAGVTVLSHVVNLGKGAALKTGCDYAIKRRAQSIVVMDADGQHDAAEIPKFTAALRSCDVVFGFRKLDKMPTIFKFGNWFINVVTHWIYGIELRDTQCGFRAFTRRAYKKIRWDAADYSMESEMVSKVGKHRLRYVEIPIETIYDDSYKGTTVLDGARIVLNMFLWRLRK